MCSCALFCSFPDSVSSHKKFPKFFHIHRKHKWEKNLGCPHRRRPHYQMSCCRRLDAMWCNTAWWWWCQRGETMSLNCSHQQAYCSSPMWYMSMENHGRMMWTKIYQGGEWTRRSHWTLMRSISKIINLSGIRSKDSIKWKSPCNFICRSLLNNDFPVVWTLNNVKGLHGLFLWIQWSENKEYRNIV
jgi:hypothetical protein